LSPIDNELTDQEQDNNFIKNCLIIDIEADFIIQQKDTVGKINHSAHGSSAS